MKKINNQVNETFDYFRKLVPNIWPLLILQLVFQFVSLTAIIATVKNIKSIELGLVQRKGDGAI